MRRQTRPFVVEIKQKRGAVRRNRSIWGDLDLSALADEAVATPTTVEQLIVAPPDDSRPWASGGDIAATPFAKTAGETGICPEAAETAVPNDFERVDTPTDDGTPRRRARVGRRHERALPRGERWKLRLPKALRKKR